MNKKSYMTKSRVQIIYRKWPKSSILGCFHLELRIQGPLVHIYKHFPSAFLTCPHELSATQPPKLTTACHLSRWVQILATLFDSRHLLAQ